MSPGRPRDASIDGAVLAATVDLLRERGWSGFAVEAVATRAGTTKAAIRRRWPSRQRLAVDALATLLDTPEVPDNACTRCDLIASVDLLTELLHDRLPPGVLAALLADCTETELREYLVNTLIAPSRDAARTAVDRAVGRGELREDVGPALVVDLLASAVYQRVLFGAAPQDARTLVDVLLRGVAVDFDRLLWISRQPKEARHHH
ncbi:TetR/AcrR family transcriptional regulator [Actinophytocola oryzae]|uniref:TetR family transcriptional regulator n=1 Tax=Actinophytocola oryzae TaxID=502181 RepID=A0A4R7W7W4_9PSEU|nr:TetR/AcrR family transcriptional regulator [Actinophytocola oryzae]TDV57767.1 TetR family transcriptional regulator [Actinophytocola oryzae]